MSVLDSDIAYLKGVGPRRAEPLQKAGVKTFRDLLRYYPRRYLDRSTITPIQELREKGAPVTVVGTVRQKRTIPGRRGRSRLEVTIEDGSGAAITCVWFRGTKWVGKVFNEGDRVAFHGKVEKFGARFSMVHPDFDKLDSDAAMLDTGRIIPLYPGGAALERVGLTSRSFRRLIYGLIKEHGLELEENLPESIREKYNLIDGRVALRAVHFPKNRDELRKARERLIFEEFFFLQLLLAQVKGRQERHAGHVFSGDGELMRRLVREILPFELTGDQKKALHSIREDTTSGRQMNRLVQGDVGSGKTVVGVAAMLMAIDAGHQAAFMAPTEILAEQHAANLQTYLDPLGVDLRLLVGGQKKSEREGILEELRSGVVQAVVGTHALLEESVAFENLGMVVIDEQHRFGVMQRAVMATKGIHPHVLLLTATPIPRSLAMTAYGDLDVSVIREMPAGRKPVKTHLVKEPQRDKMLGFLESEMGAGRQVYVVYPLVEESEKMDLKDAESGFRELRRRFPDAGVELVHGRMKSDEKDQAMARFTSGEARLLVATTVIEVGVDVPNATVMVIEHAERFGLAQLHQLRGRVGRSDLLSHCFLMAGDKLTNEARERLDAMVRTTDGFEIAELDLKIRGAGDFFGTRQSGLPDFKIADLVRDQEILQDAREAAFHLIEGDPDLSKSNHRETRTAFARLAPKSLGFAAVG